MSTITLENVNNHCRACLKIHLKVEEQSLLNDVEMEQPAFYHTDRLKDLNKWMAIINPLEDVTHHNIKHYDKYPKYVCRSCYENFKNVNDFKDMVIHSFDVLTKLLSVDNKDDVKHLLPESIVTTETSADNVENANQQQLLVQESLTQDELIIKPEPIDDNEDEAYIMEANRGEFIENDWKMHDDAIDGINDSDELMDNNINLKLSIQSILLITNQGKEIIEAYNNNKSLNSCDRTFIVHKIIQYYLENDLKFNIKICKEIAEEIIKIFPSEILDTYFLQNSKKQPPKGKLWDRYQGRKKYMKKLSLTKRTLEIDDDDEQSKEKKEKFEKSETTRAELKYVRDKELILSKWKETFS